MMLLMTKSKRIYWLDFCSSRCSAIISSLNISCKGEIHHGHIAMNTPPMCAKRPFDSLNSPPHTEQSCSFSPIASDRHTVLKIN